MTDLNSYGYDSETRGFWSHTEQINWHIDRFRDTNEAALDRNTAAISAQTEQQRVDAELLRKTIDKQTEQQRVDAESGRTLFTSFIVAIQKIFGKNTGDGETSYYEMMEQEQEKMQAYISAHTSTVRQTGDTMNTKLQNILEQLDEIDGSLDENTRGDATNATGIKEAISKLKLEVNNYVNN